MTDKELLDAMLKLNISLVWNKWSVSCVAYTDKEDSGIHQNPRAAIEQCVIRHRENQS